MSEGFVPVYRANDEAAANIIRGVLEDAGITAIVQRHESSWLDGSMVPAEGYWGAVLVRKEDEHEAAELLEEYARGETSPEDEE
jgi:hypothetical protein